MSHRTTTPRRLRMPLWHHAIVCTVMIGGTVTAIWYSTPILALIGALFGWVALDLIEKTLQHRAGSR